MFNFFFIYKYPQVDKKNCKNFYFFLAYNKKSLKIGNLDKKIFMYLQFKDLSFIMNLDLKKGNRNERI